MDRLVRNKNIFQKIIIACILVVLVNFAIPIYSQADDDKWSLMGSLMKELASLVRSLGDVVVGLLNHFMLGTSQLIGSATLDRDYDPNLTDPSSALYVNPDDIITSVDKNGNVVQENVVTIDSSELGDTLFGIVEWSVPNVLYSPENIFANKIAALDVNFINPHTYTAVEDTDKAEKKAISAAETLSGTIATWYRSLRNIAVVSLLSVLVYMGIRILLSTTAQDKAKYREALKDWAVALCLVFMIHFIMSATMVFVEKITELFDTSASKGVIIEVTGDHAMKFKTNFMGYMRFMAQVKTTGDVVAYTVIYIVLVIQTVMFTIQYLKRLLYMAFFTMIAPLVALTYPIDKMGDGQAQAFNLWFKEYTINAILQPVHLLLYTVLITSAMSLAVSNPLYAVVAIGFLIPAEKFVKKMFKLDRAESEGGLGGFAGGALAMQAWQKATSAIGNGGKKAEKAESGDSGKIRTQDNNKEALPGNDNKNLAAWKDGDDGGSSGNKQQGGTSEDEARVHYNEASQNGGNGSGTNTGEDAPRWDEWEPGDPSSPYYEQGWAPHGGPESKKLSEEEYERIFGNEKDSNPYGLETTLVRRNTDSSEYRNGALYVNGQRTYSTGEATMPRSDISQKPKKKIKGVANNKSNKLSAGVSSLGKGIKSTGNKIRNSTGGKLAIRGAKSVTGKLWRNKRRILRRAAGIAGGITLGGMGAMIGAASAIAQGDSGKILTNATAGAAAGYMGGKAAGRGTVDFIAGAGTGTYNAAKNAKNTVVNAYNEEKYGLSEARQMRLEKENKKAKKDFMKNDAEKRKYKDITAKINANKKRDRNYTLEEVMNAAYDYRNAGLDDEKTATGLNLEAAHGGIGSQNHDKMINVMQEVNKRDSEEYITDEKKRIALENRMRDTLGDEKGQQFMDLFAEAHGVEKRYNKIKQEREKATKATETNKTTENTEKNNKKEETKYKLNTEKEVKTPRNKRKETSDKIKKRMEEKEEKKTNLKPNNPNDDLNDNTTT